MKTFFFAVLFTVMSLGFFAGTAQAQGPAGGANPASQTPVTPGAGRDVSHANSTGTVRFEGLEKGSRKTSGIRWIRNGDHWQKDGTWVKNGDDVDSFADDGTKVFTYGGAGNLANSTGPVTAHIGGPGSTWTES